MPRGARSAPTPAGVPSKNPLTGRRLSGNAQRQRQRLAAAHAAFSTADEGVPCAEPRVPNRLRLPPALEDDESGLCQSVDLFAALPEAPLLGGVAACESWAAKVALVCAQAVEAGADAERALLLATCCKRLGQLAPKAQRSEQAAYVGEHGLGRKVDLLADDPPLAQPLCGVAWVFFRLCRLTESLVRRDAPVDPQRVLLLLNVLSVAGYLSCKGELRELLDRVKESAGRCQPLASTPS